MKDENLDSVLYFLMERVMRRAKIVSRQRFQQLGVSITIDQWVVLKCIAEKEQLTQKAIANLTFKEPAAVTRILDILSKQNYVERLPVVGDRRKYHLQLTDEGKVLYDSLIPHITDIRARGIEGLNQRDIDTMKESLRTMYENLI
jgi:DNA-binding MarR family transcriptional regulator